MNAEGYTMTFMPDKILLVDKWRPLCAAWSQAFGQCASCTRS